jgi:diguanylate cyclase (GGDEF)-like protein/PAS domain S-box-containing protein
VTNLQVAEKQTLLSEPQASYIEAAHANALVDTAGVALIAFDLDGYLTIWNRAAELLYGYSAAELIGRHASLVAPSNQKSHIASTIAALLRGEARRNIETVHWRADGTRIDVSLNFAVMRDERGEAIGISATARDITDEKRVETTVKRERDLLRSLVKIQQELAAASEKPLDDVMQLVCERTQDLTGAEGAGIQIPKADDMVLRSGCGTLAFFIGTEIHRDMSLLGECLDSDIILHCRDTRKLNRARRESVERMGVRSLMLVPLHGQDGIVGLLEIVSSKPGGIDESAAEVLQIVAGFFAGALDRAARADVERALRAELAALAVTDGLTGLKNHRSFQERLSEEVARAHRNETPLSVIMLDVDWFKQYNDSYGHPAGDRVLKQVAEILQRNARQTDLVARYGGEEFVLILPHTDIAGAAALAERIRADIAANAWNLRAVTASLGVAEVLPEDTPATLLARADASLYRAKSTGRNAVAA